MGVQRDSGRDALEQYFLASAIAIVLGSLLFAALAIAVLSRLARGGRHHCRLRLP